VWKLINGKQEDSPLIRAKCKLPRKSRHRRAAEFTAKRARLWDIMLAVCGTTTTGLLNEILEDWMMNVADLSDRQKSLLLSQAACLPEPYRNLYDPANERLALQVHNWCMTLGNDTSKRYRAWWYEAGMSTYEGTRVWLDRILEMLIEDGLALDLAGKVAVVNVQPAVAWTEGRLAAGET
jgi:hypothetical protein